MRILSSVAQIGWDSHRRFSQVTLRDAELKVLERRRIEHADRATLRRVLGSWPAGTPVVLEATFGWPWIADELQQAGLQPQLASSRKLAAWRKARGLAKSNRLDSDLLSELPSEKQPWWRVWLPPPAVRDERELLRYRMGLVRTQTVFKNRMHAILHRHGILHEFSDLFSAAGRSFLQKLALDRSPQAALPANARMALLGHLQLLDHLRLLIARATKLFHRQVERNPIAARLMTLPGVSWILAYTLLAEIGRIERFKSHKQLVSYSLLAPQADDSGDDDPTNPLGRHVGRAGRGTLKWAFVEAAHGAVRSDVWMREVFNRVTDGGQRNRGRGYVAVARKLAVCAFTLWKRGTDYSPLPPPRPGAESQRPPGRVARAAAAVAAAAVARATPALSTGDGASGSAPQATARKRGRARRGANAATNGRRAATNRTNAATNRPGTGQSEHPMVAVEP